MPPLVFAPRRADDQKAYPVVLIERDIVHTGDCTAVRSKNFVAKKKTLPRSSQQRAEDIMAPLDPDLRSLGMATTIDHHQKDSNNITGRRYKLVLQQRERTFGI